MKLDYSNYISPFGWRYATSEMKKIWSEEYKYRLWRKVWVTLAHAEYEAGLVTKAEYDDLKKHEQNLDIERLISIETETKHDVVAGIKEFSEKAKIGGGKIHLGATSMDIVDNADMLRIQEALVLIEQQLWSLLQSFSLQIKNYANVTCMGYTHLQPAEPTTVGYRLAFYAQDLLTDLELLTFIKSTIKAKGMKGAVGTRASFSEILSGSKFTPEKLDTVVTQKLGISPALITTQVYSRKYDFFVLVLLASIASSCAKFAADVRLLQSPGIGEWQEPFGTKQVGSSAMPFKKNPMNSEKVCSLARFVGQLAPVALENASLSYLERTLDDSANKRVIIAEGFLALDEMMLVTQKIISGLIVYPQRVAHNLVQYGPFSATETLIILAVKKGADRQEMHELMRSISMQAWSDVVAGKPNPMISLLTKNQQLLKYISESEIKKHMDVSTHVGDAPKRALQLAKIIAKKIQ